MPRTRRSLVALLAALTLLPAGPAAAAPKKLTAGLYTIGNTGEFADLVDGFVVKVDWRVLQPAPDTFRFAAIDDAIARAKAAGDTLRLKIFAGRSAPDWVKLRFGTVTVHDPIDGITAAVPRWWIPRYMEVYARLQRRLADRYDLSPVIRTVTVSGAMTVYAEPFIRGMASQETRANLLATGYSPEKDRQAILASIEAQSAWERTRQVLAFNPWQFVEPDGSFGSDVSFTNRVMEVFRAAFGRRAVLQNNSIRSSWITDHMPFGYASMYQHMRDMGGLISYQTARTARVGDLPTVLAWAIDQGAHGVELHAGSDHKMSYEQARQFDLALESNA
jgi:hypothetical protein